MKKLVSIMLTAALIAVPAFASGSKETPATPVAEQGTTASPVTIWSWDPNFNIPIMQSAIDNYKMENPDVNFNIVEMSKADCEQKLNTILASGSKKGLPDIVLIEDYNAQKYLNSYPGKFAELTNEFDYNTFIDNKTSYGIVDGKNYSVPFDSGVAGFFYRPSMLKMAGIAPADLENITWDQFCDLAAQYKEKTGNYFFANSKSDGGLLRIMLQSNGDWYFNEDGSVNIKNNDSLANAMRIYKRFETEDLCYPTTGWTDWVGAINDGKVASITSGCWIIGYIKAGTDQSGDWALAPVPRLSEEGTNASNLGGSSWYVINESANKDAAINFMKAEYGADNSFYQEILTNNGAIGSYKPSYTGSAYTTGDSFFGGQKVYADLANYAQKIPSINVGQYTYEADAAVMGNMQSYYDGTDLTKVLESMNAQLTNQIQ